jgi:type II secretory pathway pseudopilin PulG
MNCSQCQTPLTEGAQFCSACGATSVPGGMPGGPAKKSGMASCAIIAAVVAVVGIFLIGIVAAIAVPNFLSAVQRGKQKRTMGDMKTLASAIESYKTDSNHYPAGNSMDELCKTLMPDYLAECIRKDGWSSAEHLQEFRYVAWEGDPKGCGAAGSAPGDAPAGATDKDGGVPAEPPAESVCGPQHYVLVSAGKDGKFQVADPRDYQEGHTTSFDSDIVIKDSQFLREPTGKQSYGPAN